MDNSAIEAAGKALYENEWKGDVPDPWDKCASTEKKYWVDSAQAAIDAYLESSGVAKDAARYRWLRDMSLSAPSAPRPPSGHWWNSVLAKTAGEAFSGAVDAAMATQDDSNG